jgi:hypothetical protein
MGLKADPRNSRPYLFTEASELPIILILLIKETNLEKSSKADSGSPASIMSAAFTVKADENITPTGNAPGRSKGYLRIEAQMITW